MSSKKKVRRFPTWADAEIAHSVSDRMAAVLDIALHDLVRGTVKWVEGAKAKKIGLCRLTEAHGGVVILVERTMVGARYLEEWATGILAIPAPNAKDYSIKYKAWLDTRWLATAALEHRAVAKARAAEAAKGCQRIPIAGEVDQDIRKY